MTDRYHTLTVTLEHDVRTDDIEPLMSAIRCLRGVLSVSGVVADYESHMAEERAVRVMGKRLWAVLYPEDER